MTIAPLPPDLAGRDWTLYQPDPFGRLGRGTWGHRPEPAPEDDDPDPEVNRLRRAWQRNGYFTDAEILLLDNGVGRGQPNNRADVARIEAALHRAGHYDVGDTNGPTGYFGPPQEEAIKAFQQQAGLTVDGWLGRDGETAQALVAAQPDIGDVVMSDASDVNIMPGDDDKPVDVAQALPKQKEEADMRRRMTPPPFQGTRKSLLDPPMIVQIPRPVPFALPGQRPANSNAPKASSVAPAPASLPTVREEQPVQPPGILPSGMRMVGRDGNASPELPSLADYQREKKSFADFIADGVAAEMAKRSNNPDGSRGNKWTVLGNNIVARECRNVINEEIQKGFDVDHKAGAYKDGGAEYLKEEVLKKPGETGLLGSAKPDFTWAVTDENGKTEYVRLNSADQLPSGQFTPREENSLEKVRINGVSAVVAMMPKFLRDGDEAEYTELARNTCRSIFRKYLKPVPSVMNDAIP